MNNSNTTQLVKCQVKNAEGIPSHRLIEKDNFDLWRYLVTTKHHITISQTDLGLWMTQDEFSSKQEIYERAGTLETANRITLMLFDNDGNFSHTCRYTPAGDTEEVTAILKSHIPQPQLVNNQFSIDIDEGMLVCSGPLPELTLVDSTMVENTKFDHTMAENPTI